MTQLLLSIGLACLWAALPWLLHAPLWVTAVIFMFAFGFSFLGLALTWAAGRKR